MKILAMGAHPDDIEIFMFGLLSVLKKRGDHIFTTVVTDGSLGGSISKLKLKELRYNEAISGLKKFSKPNFLDIPDGQLGEDIEHKKIIKKNIFKIMPDLIITHSEDDYHNDHRRLSSLVRDLAVIIYQSFFMTMMGINFKPNYYVDIRHFGKQRSNFKS